MSKSYLSLSAVALKLVQSLEKTLQSGYPLEEFVEMVMLSTVADIVPLVEENRTLVKLGLESFEKTGFLHKGLRRLYDLTGLEELTSGAIGYRIAPAINAAGRLGEVEDVMALLVDEDLKKAETLFRKNEERTQIERRLTTEVLKRIREEKLYEDDIILVGGTNWHTGVIGIVASRVQEIWHKPVILVGFDEEGFGRGSCRSIEGFNIFEALSSTPDVFESFGGHALAAGFSLKRENFEKLRENLKAYTNAKDMRELFIKKYQYDLEASPEEFTFKDVEELKQMEPFGVGNPAPVFKVRAEAKNVRTMGSENKHLSFDTGPIRAVAFNKAAEYGNIENQPITFLAKAEINCYNNRKKLQFNVKDIKVCPFNSFSAAQALLAAQEPEYIASQLDVFSGELDIARPQIVVIYNILKKYGERGFTPASYSKRTGENALTLAAGLRILAEAGLVEYGYENGTVTGRLVPTGESKDLTSTPTYCCIEEIKKFRKDE